LVFESDIEDAYTRFEVEFEGTCYKLLQVIVLNLPIIGVLTEVYNDDAFG